VFSEVMRERGAEPTTVELDRGEPLPDWREFDAVLAMGGPMGTGDDADHAWLGAERALVRDAVGAGRPFLGVCLGVQLLAAALGARVHAAAHAEVGLLDVTLTAAGRADPLFAGLPGRIVSLQWHGDTFDLPDGAVLLASSPIAPHQAFRVGAHAYGVQFHLEVTPQMARQWGEIPAYRDALAATLGDEGGRAFLAEVEARAGELGTQARTLMEGWLDMAGSAV
jgi:GMP synthase-like glutamine amidotransferase